MSQDFIFSDKSHLEDEFPHIKWNIVPDGPFEGISSECGEFFISYGVSSTGCNDLYPLGDFIMLFYNLGDTVCENDFISIDDLADFILELENKKQIYYLLKNAIDEMS